ncbi:hypothetical protein UCREL1_11749 [Eutypa lata UCREL1]|uniref:Uncharacterized protein n=1 Tax=Eutypa lata (strain UCR-EL1) TaxID=1287681 RepID=M7S5F5_EUTLA|nr:hypothetical protein UCREL1_11749 [Eutypa lata UCREL1]
MAAADPADTDYVTGIPGSDGWPAVKRMMRRVAIAARARQVAEESPLKEADLAAVAAEAASAGIKAPKANESRPYRRPTGLVAIQAQEDLHQRWLRTFPNGRRVVVTPGAGFLCGLYAVMISMRGQYPGLPQPTAKDLQYLDPADPAQKALQNVIKIVTQAKVGGGEDNFAIDHLTALVGAWAGRNGLAITLCVEINGNDGNPRPIYFNLGSNLPIDATIQLWVHHNNFNHYSGIVGTRPNGADAEDVSRVNLKL